MANTPITEGAQLKITDAEIQQIASAYDDKTPQEIIRWGVDTFGDGLALACSFGAEDVAIVDMLVKIDPKAKIFYLDTDVLFKETYDVRDRILERYHANLIRYSPKLTLEQQAKQHGDALWSVNPNACCNIRKVEPLERALQPLDAWITGVRRDQAPTRANTKVVEADPKFGLVKINPLAGWVSEQVWKYIQDNDVPYNVLHDQGYPSIGCTHCTRAVKPGEDPRAGRWAGFQKTECGLHFDNK